MTGPKDPLYSKVSLRVQQEKLKCPSCQKPLRPTDSQEFKRGPALPSKRVGIATCSGCDIDVLFHKLV